MKSFEFDHKDKAWDRYSAFHSFNGNFVEFETGELMIVGAPDPHNRQYYPKYNVRLVTTTDSACPKLYFDKECTKPVKKAWVTHKGQQHLAIDYERNVAIAYDIGYRLVESTVLGNHVSSASVYWAGSERLPHVLNQIKVQTPNTEYKKKVQTVLKEAEIAVTALWRMQASEDSNWWYDTKMLAKEKWHDSSVGEIVADITSNADNFKSVANNGFAYPRVTTKVDFLYVKQREE